MRYRRYYPKENKDGSVTVTSYGPVTAPIKRLSMKQWFVTWFVLAIGFCLLSPFHSNPAGNAQLIWVLSWSVGLTILVSLKGRTGPKTPRVPARDREKTCSVMYKDGKRVYPPKPESTPAPKPDEFTPIVPANGVPLIPTERASQRVPTAPSDPVRGEQPPLIPQSSAPSQ
jgi:hypothetical protein